jgi:hypothetical protein
MKAIHMPLQKICKIVELYIQDILHNLADKTDFFFIFLQVATTFLKHTVKAILCSALLKVNITVQGICYHFNQKQVRETMLNNILNIFIFSCKLQTTFLKHTVKAILCSALLKVNITVHVATTKHVFFKIWKKILKRNIGTQTRK